MQFIDLAAQQRRIKDKINHRIKAVLDHGAYIMGPEVAELEAALADFCGAKYCVSCANGTDALQIVMMALDIGPGDAVFVPSFTFAATAEAPCLVGTTPVFVDINPGTYTMDPDSLRRAIEHARAINLTPKAVIPVDLFGLAADYPTLEAIAEAEGIVMISDSAQGWGATIEGRMTGTFGDVTTTSFFPAKPLGCYGDGGAIFTDDAKFAALLDSIRVHGKGTEKYDNVRIGMNSRLDTLQAAILLEKLAIYADEISSRNRIAARYSAALQDLYQVPEIPAGFHSIWAQYTLQARGGVDRQKIMANLKEAGIPTAVYYPRPLHTQTGYGGCPVEPLGLPKSKAAAANVFSLPMHPYLEEATQDLVIKAARAAIGAG